MNKTLQQMNSVIYKTGKNYLNAVSIVATSKCYDHAVKFVSEIISVKRDKNNKVVEGDPNKIKTVIDKWKFTRQTSSSSPNWYLAEIKNSWKRNQNYLKKIKKVGMIF